jgi:ribonuclease III
VREPSGSDVEWLWEVTGYRARDERALEHALTHRSVAGADNERLEFLGDAVLSFVVADLLYAAFPTADEGDLSRFRAALVSGEELGEVGEAVGIGARVRLGPGELRSGGFRRRSIMGDAFEAILGFIYREGGIEAAQTVIARLWGPRIERLATHPPQKDAKTRLQEWLQGQSLPLPSYEVVAVRGPAHAQSFTVRCQVADPLVDTEAVGSSRRRAEQLAAELVLEQIVTVRSAP